MTRPSRPSVRQLVEANGLVLIAVAIALIFWFIDALASDQGYTRLLIVCMVVAYGVMTQTLINGRKAALLEKERTQEQLIQSESLAAIGQLVAGIAHELNNPLASASSLIQTDLELLQEEKDKRQTDRALAEDLAYSLKELDRTQEIVRSILDLSRQTQSYREDVQMNDVIDDALRVLHNHYKRMDVVIEKAYAPDLPAIPGNFSNLGQVLINILKNALDALPEGRGTIHLATSHRQDTDRIVVVCRDDGVGMPPEVRKHAFAPFFTTKEVGDGTGLGLYVSHEIVKKHGGDIRIESDKGKGTTVTIRLPCARSGAS